MSESIGTNRFSSGDPSIPELLSEFLEQASNLELESVHATLLTGPEIVEFVTGLMWPLGEHAVGLWPFLHDNQSNYLAFAAPDPLAPRVVHIPHDGDKRILFRDLGSCQDFLAQAVKSGEHADAAIDAADGDYSPRDPNRTADDRQAARYLMSTNGENGEWNLAVQLLDATDLNEWATLLETEHFVRRDVRKRLAMLQTPATKHLIAEDQKRFDQFVSEVANSARMAGLSVGGRNGEVLQIGGNWIGLETFFYRRHIRDAMPRIITWFKDQAAGRHPRKTPGHFFDDSFSEP